MRIVYNAVARTPKLAQCTMSSIVRAVLLAAELGLEAGSGTGHAYLVPFGNEAQLIVGYRGLLDLVRRTGDVSSVTTNAVYEGDEFEIEFGLQDKLRHVPKADPDPAKLVAVYAVVRFRDGSHQMGYMTRKQVDTIRARSRAGNAGPWVTDYAEMARKTVLRNVLKYCPMSLEAAKAVSADVYADTGDASALAAFSTEIEAEPEPEPQPRGKALAQRIKAREAAETRPEPDTVVDEPEVVAEEPAPEPEPSSHPYPTGRVGDGFRALAVRIGLLEPTCRAEDVVNLRAKLLTEPEHKGLTWRDIDETLWRVLVDRAEILAAERASQ